MGLGKTEDLWMKINQKKLNYKRVSAYSSVLRTFIAGVISMMIVSCDREVKYEDAPEEHIHTQEELEAYPYLGYYACERGITDLKVQKFSSGTVSCVGLKEGRLWFAYFQRESAELNYEWEASTPFSKEITYEMSDGSQQRGTVESISVRRIKQSYYSVDECDIVFVLRYTLTDGIEVFQPVFEINSRSKSGILPIIDKLDVLHWSLGDIILVNDRIYNYDGIEIYRFPDDFEKPQDEEMERFKLMSHSLDMSVIYRLESVKVRDNKCAYVEYIGKELIWEYDFAPLFADKEITAVKLGNMNGSFETGGVADLKITAKDAEGNKQTYKLELNMKDGSFISLK